MSADSDRPIIIKKIKKGGHGHHGGAWKVAYADFVTAMMAFFLLMWLLNATSSEQKQGIADYFTPAAVSKATSGSGGILGGTAFSTDGVRGEGSLGVPLTGAQPGPPPTPPSRREPSQDEGQAEGEGSGEAGPETGAPVQTETLSQSALERALAMREDALFQQAEMSLRQAMRDMPDIAELSKQLIIDHTPEGMRIQLVDQEGRAMFAPDSAEPYPRTRTLLGQVARILQRLPNRIAISGHTDAAPITGRESYSNWEMSADRANAARRILQTGGVDDDRLAEVTGRAGTEPLLPDDPYAPANRRVAIVLLREAPPLPPGHGL